jgi:hypothetical protein
MKIALLAGAAFAAVATTTAFAGDAAGSTEPSWEFEVSASPTFVRDGDDFTSATATADHGPLHLEARYNYESVGARSAFVGWTFSGGEETTWELTPIVGGAGNDAGFRARTRGDRDPWKIRSLRRSRIRARQPRQQQQLPLFLERVGLAGRLAAPRNCGSAHPDLRRRTQHQRGPFADFTIGKFRIAGYWFNPGSSEQVIVTTIGAGF